MSHSDNVLNKLFSSHQSNMLLLTTVGWLVIGMTMEAVESAATPSFNMFNKNLMYSVRPGEDGLKNSIDGSGKWMRGTNSPVLNGAYQYGKAEDPTNYMPGTSANNTLFGIGSVLPNGANLPVSEVQKEANGQSPEPYTMFFRSSKHTRCEECDKDGKIKGTMLVKENGVEKMINYEALTAKNAEDSPTNMNPAQVNNPLNSGPPPFDGLTYPVQNYNQIPSPMGQRMVIPNNIPGQMSPLNGGIPQQLSLPPSTPSQIPLMPQQNNIPYILAQTNNAPQNGMPPQTTPTIETYASQMPSAMTNAGQGNQQQMIQRLAEALGPTNQVGNQMIAQRASDLMSGVYQNQQRYWNEANHQMPAASLVNPSMNTGEVASSSPDQANFAAMKSLWQNGMAVPLVLVSQTPGQQQFTLANLGGTPSKDNSVAAVLSKDQTTELKPDDEVNLVKKITAEIVDNIMHKNEDGKEPNEQIVSTATR